MSEAHIVLIYLLATVLVTLLAGFTALAVAHSKNRIIREQRRALAAEQRLRRAQEAFTDNAHHELRTPLLVLSGHLQMLQDLDPTPLQAAALARAGEAAAHLGHLVQSLLDLSSLGQGTLRVQAAPADLGAHLAKIGARFQARAKARGLTADLSFAPLPRPLVCDAARLCQALEALLDNALGFTERGELSFRMEARPQGRAWHLRFEIRDQGPGLPPDWHRLLRPFEQEEHSLRRRRGGLGIGLPLASGILERLGGTLGLAPLAIGTLAWVEITFEEV